MGDGRPSGTRHFVDRRHERSGDHPDCKMKRGSVRMSLFDAAEGMPGSTPVFRALLRPIPPDQGT